MYAVEFMTERLKEQIDLAPRLEENTEPGGRTEDLLERLREGASRAHHIEILKAVEMGARRYASHLEKAGLALAKLLPLWDQIALVRGAPYADQLQRDKAMARFKDAPAQVIELCKAAIAELHAALKVLGEGEGRTAQKLKGVA